MTQSPTVRLLTEANAATDAANPATPLGAALNATILDKIKTDSVPKWKATAAYLAGDKVLSPAGDVVSAKANFTSGASFDPANWNYSETFVPKVSGLDTVKAVAAAALRPFHAAVDNATGSYVRIVGHSVIAGTGAANPWQQCAQLIAAGITAIDPRATVTIDGHSSYTSTQLLALYEGTGVNANFRSLTIFMGLLNDYYYGVNPATTLDNLTRMVASMKAIKPAGSPDPAFVILLEWLRGDVATPAYPWSAYVAAARQVAAADPTVILIDLGTRMGAAGTDIQGLYSVDLAHPSSLGHAMIARLTLEGILAGYDYTRGAVWPDSAYRNLLNNPSAILGAPIKTTDAHGWVVENTGTQNQYIEETIGLRQGLYRIALHHRKGSNRGIYSISVDGTVVGTIDGYAATSTDAIDMLTGVSLAGTRPHVIRFTMTGKNASSSNYVMSVSKLSLSRTSY
jgi:lysophospholipase L1-like esterase